MPHLSRHIPPSHILLDVEVPDKWALIEKMVAAIVASPTHGEAGPSFEAASSAVCARERERTTALGEAFALPHARLGGFRGPEICLASLKTPVDFDAPDGRPVRFVCLVLTPLTAPTVALKVQSWAVKLFMDPEFRDFLATGPTPEEVHAFLRKQDVGLEVPVVARDIMRQALVNIYVDTPLRETTRRMMDQRLEAVAVLNRDGTIAGEITCDALFQSGIPDFFRQLKSVSFIRQFDPFEKYFARESEATAGDLMRSGFSAMSEDATLLEIVFALTVRRHPKIYVVDPDGRRIGVIDRIAVLDRVINF
ncbi:MAG: PTS transporter subunit EIIA [Kiritimatiellaeota bacterium]|nr:PTS transporter subunit EIIA [Kiritimatiellota bacterium]